jgi:hypothetical protein
LKMGAIQKGRTGSIGMILLALAAGCNSDDTERLGRVGHKLAVRAESITGEADGRLNRGWQAMRGELAELALDGRVITRLRWDKNLEGAQIQVTAQDGVLELKGLVRDVNQRRRAVELAESTVGVAKVHDGLELATKE